MEILERILTSRLIAVLRLPRQTDAVNAARAIVDGGITTIEITATTPGYVNVIRMLATDAHVLVGVGTVMDVRSAIMALDAGALFCASPVTDARVVESVLSRSALAMPGALTPTEIVYAHSLGAGLVKVYPVPPDPVAYIRSLRGPLPHIPLAPSGGVTMQTASALLMAGSAALNVGTWLTHGDDGALLAPGDMAVRAANLVEAINQ